MDSTSASKASLREISNKSSGVSFCEFQEGFLELVIKEGEPIGGVGVRARISDSDDELVWAHVRVRRYEPAQVRDLVELKSWMDYFEALNYSALMPDSSVLWCKKQVVPTPAGIYQVVDDVISGPFMVR